MMCSVTTDCLRQSLKVVVLLYISVISGSWPPSNGFLNLQATNTKYLTCTTITLQGLQKWQWSYQFCLPRTAKIFLHVGLAFELSVNEPQGGVPLFRVPERNSLITKKAWDCWDITWHAVLRVMTRQSVKLLQDICPFCNVSYLESMITYWTDIPIWTFCDNFEAFILKFCDYKQYNQQNQVFMSMG